MNAVEAQRVTRTFGAFTAVADADLVVGQGEIVGLLGANGAGKTTLMKMVLGLLPPSSGRVQLFGRPPARDLRRRIGYVPQNLGLYADLTVSENLQFRASVFATTPTECESARALVGALPLGMQRRVAFAAATQHDPDLLLLDEPTSGVSPLERSRLWDLIHLRAQRGTAVLVSTHYMDEAEQADRLVIMASGRVTATGTAAGIIDDRRVIEVEGQHWGDVYALFDGEGRRAMLAGRTVRLSDIDRSNVEAALARAGMTASVREVPATLEEVLVDGDLEAG